MKPLLCRSLVFWPLFILSLAPMVTFGQDQPYTFQHNVMIPMRDEVKLAANLFLPKEDGPFPVILMRSPYGKSDENFGEGKFYASNGYAFLFQDCRGKGDSEGEWNPFFYDQNDGFDTLTWISQQSWCNGSVGTMGGSYVGWTQWSLAPNAPKVLKAMIPVVPFTKAYEIMYSGGAYQLALANGWGLGVSGKPIDMQKIDLGEAFKKLPLQTWDEQFGYEVFFLRDWVRHNTYDEFWQKRSINEHFSDITVPILNIGGWYDIFAKATLDQINQVRKQSKSHAVRRNVMAILGPWTHGVNQTQVGEVDFGNAAKLNFGKLQFDWYEYWLKGKDTGVQEWPPFYLFVMGENQWRGENEWPLARTLFTNYYLHSEGKANTRNGNGILNPQSPGGETTDTYVYDPANPVPSVGGNNLVGAPAGPYDQSPIEDRNDILVFTTEELKEPVEVTGPVKLMLYAASNAPDTDFTGKLVDVAPDGKAINLCEGILRARARESVTNLSLIEPGKIYRYEIDLWVTSNLFQAGHRIRLEVSSSNFPRFDRNPNSGKEFGTDTEVQPATQTIYHDKTYPSHLVLPIIPRGE